MRLGQRVGGSITPQVIDRVSKHGVTIGRGRSHHKSDRATSDVSPGHAEGITNTAGVLATNTPRPSLSHHVRVTVEDAVELELQFNPRLPAANLSLSTLSPRAQSELRDRRRRARRRCASTSSPRALHTPDIEAGAPGIRHPH